MQTEEWNSIEGTVEAVIFQNQENGYTVLKLDAGESGGITVVGCLPGVSPGESITVQGVWMRHTAYGEQFKAETVERRMPAGEKAIYEYLASGAVRGIGAATARRMVELFGQDALTVLEETPERLTAIRGISRRRALAMGEAFRLQMGMRRLLEFLGQYGLPLQLAMPLYRRFGDRALEAVLAPDYSEVMADREAFPIAAVVNTARTDGAAQRALSGAARAFEPGFFVEVSEALARIRGLQTGDVARVSNERGAVEAPVLVTTRLAPFTCEGNEVHYVMLNGIEVADDEAEGAVAPVVGRSWAPLAPGVASAAGGGFEAKGFLVNVEKAEVA